MGGKSCRIVPPGITARPWKNKTYSTIRVSREASPIKLRISGFDRAIHTQLPGNHSPGDLAQLSRFGHSATVDQSRADVGCRQGTLVSCMVDRHVSRFNHFFHHPFNKHRRRLAPGSPGPNPEVGRKEFGRICRGGMVSLKAEKTNDGRMPWWFRNHLRNR